MRLRYSCRACKRPIQAVEGCTFCSDVKKVLVVDTEEDVSAIDVVGEGVSALKDQLREYKKKLVDCPPKDREGILERIRQVTAKLPQIADAYRKLASDSKEAVNALSIQEQKALFVSWYADQPAKVRADVIASLQTREAEMNMGSRSFSSVEGH